MLAEPEEAESISAPALISTFVPPPPMPEPAAEPTQEQEYEPAEASASYRIDPVPPSQYVQAAPELEPTTPAPAEPALPEPRHTITEFLEHEAQDFNPETLTPEPAEQLPEPAPEAHDITSIFATGDMYSEAPQLTTQEFTAPLRSSPGSTYFVRRTVRRYRRSRPDRPQLRSRRRSPRRRRVHGGG